MFTEWEDIGGGHEIRKLVFKYGTSPVLVAAVEKSEKVFQPKVMTGDGEVILWSGDLEAEYTAKDTALRETKKQLVSLVSEII